MVVVFWGRLALHQHQLAWVWRDTVKTILMVFWGRLALHQHQLAWVWRDTVKTILMVVAAASAVIVLQNDVDVLEKISNVARNVIWAVRLVKTNKFQNSCLMLVILL